MLSLQAEFSSQVLMQATRRSTTKLCWWLETSLKEQQHNRSSLTPVAAGRPEEGAGGGAGGQGQARAGGRFKNSAQLPLTPFILPPIPLLHFPSSPPPPHPYLAGEGSEEGDSQVTQAPPLHLHLLLAPPEVQRCGDTSSPFEVQRCRGTSSPLEVQRCRGTSSPLWVKRC